MKKYLIVFVLLTFAHPSLATDPSEMAHQCEQYGSYQNAEGEWVTCEYEEEPEDDEAEVENGSTEFDEESNF